MCFINLFHTYFLKILFDLLVLCNLFMQIFIVIYLINNDHFEAQYKIDINTHTLTRTHYSSTMTAPTYAQTFLHYVLL